MTAPKAAQPPRRGRGRPANAVDSSREQWATVRLDDRTKAALATLERLWGGRHPNRADLIRDGLELAAETASKKNREGA